MKLSRKFSRCVQSVRRTIKARKGSTKESAAIGICTKSVLHTRGRTLKRYSRKRLVTQKKMKGGDDPIIRALNKIEIIEGGIITRPGVFKRTTETVQPHFKLTDTTARETLRSLLSRPELNSEDKAMLRGLVTNGHYEYEVLDDDYTPDFYRMQLDNIKRVMVPILSAQTSSLKSKSSMSGLLGLPSRPSVPPSSA